MDYSNRISVESETCTNPFSSTISSGDIDELNISSKTSLADIVWPTKPS